MMVVDKTALEELREVCEKRGIDMITLAYPLKRCIAYIVETSQILIASNCKDKHIRAILKLFDIS